MRRGIAVALGLLSAPVVATALARWRVASFERLDERDLRSGATVATSDGVLHYVERGAGEPLLLIHGLGASIFTFRRNIDGLARSFRVIAVDLAGFGGSSRSVRDYSQEAHARRLVELMDALGIPRAHVLGHSMGGAVALRLAARWPERVMRLVLVAPAPPDMMRAGALATTLLRPFFPLFGLLYHSRRFRRFTLRSAFHDPARMMTDEVLDGYWGAARVRGHLEALSRLMADRRKDPPVDLAKVTAPTLILWGASDTWLRPALGERLAAQLPDARLVIVPEAGHLLPEERPDEFVAHVEAFLSGREAPVSHSEAGRR
ncbi:MAG TPA: alpha/beta fold hydrolase [Dehalococcoidia bacterium]|nr:alpha/beta fold hydrolase [Dehalococcoidia bacterium]